MPYVMVFEVDGGCRNNGGDRPYAASACVLMRRNGTARAVWTKKFGPRSLILPTNQRAELMAVILALRAALQLKQDLDIDAWLDITIKSDSAYATKCMTHWIYKWEANGWINSRGYDVANQDLLMAAWDLQQEIEDDDGEVCYLQIPRALNQLADDECNELLDDMEQ